MNMHEALGAPELGETIPPNNLHAISVGLPTWDSNVGWGRRDEWVVKKMNSGYPRFFIHKSIVRLADEIAARYGNSGDGAMLFPSRKIAEMCRDFLYAQKSSLTPQVVRIVELAPLHMPTKSNSDLHRWLSLYAVIYPAENFSIAKSFWQHTGEGISSRRAEFHREFFNDGNLVEISCVKNETESEIKENDAAKHRGLKSDWLETERQIREDLRLAQSVDAKIAIRERIAKAISSSVESHGHIKASDVYLYATGMSAIFYVHRMLLAVQRQLKSVCYGFNYLDTAKILRKFGPGCLFYGHGSAEDLDELERKLQSGEKYLGFFCEFPGNPLLNSPDMKRIQKLASEYDLIVIVDETVGTFVNVDVLSYADIICTSLSKIFSGACDVMGGSVVLNPNRPNYARLKAGIESLFVDDYFPLDSIVMDQNSQDFESRILKINTNAEAICALLQSYPSVKWVYYPKYSPTREFYDECRRPSGGYGYLLSIIFHQRRDAIQFIDAIDVPKGPSLGTNFTLASPYTLLAHFGELEWAAKYGVVEDLVRISVGMEDIDILIDKVKKAMNTLEKSS